MDRRVLHFSMFNGLVYISRNLDRKPWRFPPNVGLSSVNSRPRSSPRSWEHVGPRGGRWGPKKHGFLWLLGGVETPENRWVIIFWRKKRCHNLGDTSHSLTHGYLKQNHRNWADSNQDLAGTPNPPCPLLPFGTPSASNTSLVRENRTEKCGTCASQGIVTGLESIWWKHTCIHIYNILWVVPEHLEKLSQLLHFTQATNHRHWPSLAIIFSPASRRIFGAPLSPQGGDLCWCTDRWPGFILIEVILTNSHCFRRKNCSIFYSTSLNNYWLLGSFSVSTRMTKQSSSEI